jgi:serine/threonine-protein kinase
VPASAETNAKLQDDIQLALRYELDGTPLVLLNGRKAVAFAPFLYAMVLTGGALDDPAFASLPPANPNAPHPLT